MPTTALVVAFANAEPLPLLVISVVALTTEHLQISYSSKVTATTKLIIVESA
jgi:hypothetical protein